MNPSMEARQQTTRGQRDMRTAKETAEFYAGSFVYPIGLDREAVLTVTKHCTRALIVHEDSRTGGIGESLAAIIQEEAFEALDAPIRILGALDTPVPYSPPLEEVFLVSEDEIHAAAKLLTSY